jgi:type II secretory pathway component PulL
MKYINKANCASVKITSSGSAVLSLKSANIPYCLYFENTDQLAEAIRKRQIRTKKWIIAVSDNLCITKSIELPASDIAQAYKMLEFELSSHLPLPIEELVYGCVPVSKSGNLLKVSVHILKVKTLEDILAKFRSVGIRPSRVMVDSTAIQSWFKKDIKNDITGINLMFGKENLFISAAKNDSFQRYDEILLQEGGLESQREQITEEINHLITDLSADKHQSVLRIAARGNIRTEVKSWFKGDFNNIECLELPQLNSFAKASDCTENDFTFESVVTQGLLKAAEDSALIFLNLLPGKALKKAEQKQLITNAAVTVVLGIFVVFCLWLNFAVINWRIQSACQKITKEIAPIKHIAADVESKRQRVKAIQTQLSNRELISRIFSQLYRYSPEQISISRMDYSSKADSASVNIKGQADTLSNAFEYSDAMKDSELLNNIQIINAQQIPRPGGSIVEFKAQCNVKGS